MPQRQPKRGRLWLVGGSCIRLRPERVNHVWAYDVVEDRTWDGRTFRMLCVVDEFTREAQAARNGRCRTRLGSPAPAPHARFVPPIREKSRGR